MKICPKFHVKKRTPLAIAGAVWIIAGVNVVRLGILAYISIGHVSLIKLLLSALVFGLFGGMFYKMSHKHSHRIERFKEHSRPFWHFFDIKAYLIMALMMSDGIWLRGSGLVPPAFIAVFYTGLGLALAAAGIYFWAIYLKGEEAAEELINNA